MGSPFPVNFGDTILNIITLNAATVETSYHSVLNIDWASSHLNS